jgi:pimeloyl-ACP methyl ester carboxylesterase
MMDTLEEYKNTRQKLFRVYGIQPKSKFVSTAGPVKKVHYLEMGKGKPLVMLHGGGSHSSEWINIMKPLADHYNLYVVDRPGCGLTDPVNYRGVDFRKSSVDFISSFMDAVWLSKATFIGNSMGGYFSMVFAMDFPERVEKLILIGAPASLNYYIPVQLRLLGWRGVNSLIKKTLAKPGVSGLKAIHKQILVRDIKNIPEEYFIHSSYNHQLNSNLDAFSTMLENVLTLKGWRKDLYNGDQLHQLKVPARFIWGSDDAFEGPDTGKKKAEAINDCQFEVVEGAGHCPWLDKPGECVSLILKMLTG